jgi:hypothetical protein
MRRSRWIMALALVAAVGACSPDDAADTEVEDRAAARPTLPEPACEPSEGMPLEGRASPYDSATLAVGDGMAKVCYGRPSLRGREMIGGEAVPYGELWRTGANEPTTLHVNVAARIAGLDVAPGSYSIYTIPQPGLEWTLIVNPSTSQWGHESQYTEEIEAQELGRVQVPVEAMDQQVEQLTLRSDERRQGIVLEWQNSRVFIPIEPG